MQTHRADHQAAGARLDQLIMQRVTEAAAFIDRPDGVARLDLFPHPLDQARDRETLSRLGMLMVGLHRDGDVLQVHVQTEFEDRLGWGIALQAILCCGVHVMKGCVDCFHSDIKVCARLHALVNPSWHLTAAVPGVRTVFMQFHCRGFISESGSAAVAELGR